MQSQFHFLATDEGFLPRIFSSTHTVLFWVEHFFNCLQLHVSTGKVMALLGWKVECVEVNQMDDNPGQLKVFCVERKERTGKKRHQKSQDLALWLPACPSAVCMARVGVGSTVFSWAYTLDDVGKHLGWLFASWTLHSWHQSWKSLASIFKKSTSLCKDWISKTQCLAKFLVYTRHNYFLFLL
jgi:hypothetical protein